MPKSITAMFNGDDIDVEKALLLHGEDLQALTCIQCGQHVARIELVPMESMEKLPFPTCHK